MDRLALPAIPPVSVLPLSGSGPLGPDMLIIASCYDAAAKGPLGPMLATAPTGSRALSPAPDGGTP